MWVECVFRVRRMRSGIGRIGICRRRTLLVGADVMTMRCGEEQGLIHCRFGIHRWEAAHTPGWNALGRATFAQSRVIWEDAVTGVNQTSWLVCSTMMVKDRFRGYGCDRIIRFCYMNSVSLSGRGKLSNSPCKQNMVERTWRYRWSSCWSDRAESNS